MVIFPCKDKISGLLIAFSEISQRFKAFRFIFEILMINRDCFCISVKAAKDIAFIENGECIL